MPSYLFAGLALLAGHNTLLQTAAHDDNKISNRMQEFVADQQPISINFAHPMKNSRKWGTTTPKLENGMPRMRRHDRRVSVGHYIFASLILIDKTPVI